PGTAIAFGANRRDGFGGTGHGAGQPIFRRTDGLSAPGHPSRAPARTGGGGRLPRGRPAPPVLRPLRLPALTVRHLAELAVIFSVPTGGYMATGSSIASGDSLPARYLPLAIIRSGTFHLDAFPFLFDERVPGLRIGGLPYYVVRSNGHYVSWYPVGAALAALP